MMKFSEEQHLIADEIEHNNVSVDAVAGSGKTTTSMLIAQKYNVPILLVTYNSKLRKEVRDRIQTSGLTNIVVHTFHSLMVKYFDKGAYTDTAFDTALDKLLDGYYPDDIISKFIFRIIIIDEIQDMNELYYNFMCFIIRLTKLSYTKLSYTKLSYSNTMNSYSLPLSNITYPRLVLLGDVKQSIYSYNGADTKYLTEPKKYWSPVLETNNDFNKLTLSTSYRLTNTMGSFVNMLLNNERIKTVKPSIYKPIYICGNSYNNTILLNLFTDLINTYLPGDIFIISPSIRSNRSPVKSFENIIKQRFGNRVPIYVPSNDDEDIDDDIIRGKMLISSIHQTKGRERKVVILFAFDKSYFTYFNRSADVNICTNELYVACTRASERLILLKDNAHGELSFINSIDTLCDVRGINIQKRKNIKVKYVKRSVTDLTRHLRYDIVQKAFDCISVKYSKKLPLIDMQLKIETQSISDNGDIITGWENVADILGTAIGFYAMLQTNRREEFNKLISEIVILYPEFEYIKELPDNELSSYTLCKLANYYNSVVSSYIFKVHQINDYSFMEDAHVRTICARIREMLPITNDKDTVNNIKYDFEGKLEYVIENLTIRGRYDCISEMVVDNIKIRTLWEFKCVNDITNEHILQLCLYAYLLNLENILLDKLILYNVKNHQYVEVESHGTGLEKIFNLVTEKYLK